MKDEPIYSAAEVSALAALMADRARAAILVALVDGKPIAAAELAERVGITAQTASSHLAKLVAGGLLVVERDGRHRRYTLSGDDVAEALESLSVLASRQTEGETNLTSGRQAIRLARVCYGHIGGQLGVLITSKMQSRGFLVPSGVKQFDVTRRGREWYSQFGIDVETLGSGHRGIARQCLDWSERQHHLAGPLGDRLLTVLLGHGWFVRHDGTKALQLTEIGSRALRKELAIKKQDLAPYLLDGTRASER